MKRQTMRTTDRGHPLIRKLFVEMNRQQVTHAFIEKRSGIYRSSYRAWRNMRCDPMLSSLAAVWGALGYELVAVRKEDMP